MSFEKNDPDWDERPTRKEVRHLLVFLNDMRALPFNNPEVYTALCEGEFSVQMRNSNSFGRNEADKTIENTIKHNYNKLYG